MDKLTDKITEVIICRKCGKDVEITKGVTVFTNCPRCGAPLGRDLMAENNEIKAVETKRIRYAFFKRIKKYFLPFSLALTCVALGYSIIGFFAGLFHKYGWFLGLAVLPLTVISAVITDYERIKSLPVYYRYMAYALIALNVLSLILIAVTSIPAVNNLLKY